MSGTVTKSAKQCVRPWTFQEGLPRRRHRAPRVVVPVVDTYYHHMKLVHELHQRLQLDSPRTTAASSNANTHQQGAPFRLLYRSATVVTFSRASPMGNNVPVTSPPPPRPGRSVAHPHPLLGPKVTDAWRNSTDTEPAQSVVVPSRGPKHDLDSLSSASSPEDVNGLGESLEKTFEDRDRQKQRHRQVDILKLCEHLKARGLGEPVLLTSSHFRCRDKLPPGLASRILPRDPSTREKIKGRARLDYELANLRAAAFCEQQQAQAFRTASANLRNRDVRFVEEEEREQVHKDLQEDDYDDDKPAVADDDETSSLVGSPLSREELFSRIQAWAEDVDKALHRDHPSAE